MYTISWQNYDTSGFSSDAATTPKTGCILPEVIQLQITRHQTESNSAHVECWRSHFLLLHMLPGMVEVYTNRHHSPAGDSLAFFKWVANKWVLLHSQWMSNIKSRYFDNGIQTSRTQWQHHLAGTHPGQNPPCESQRSAAIHWFDQSLPACFQTKQSLGQGRFLDSYAKHTGSGSSTQHLHCHGWSQYLLAANINQGRTGRLP